MNKEIQDHQDKMVGYLIKAIELEKESGFGILIADAKVGSVSADEILNSIAKMTTREDLKERIKKALNE